MRAQKEAQRLIQPIFQIIILTNENLSKPTAVILIQTKPEFNEMQSVKQHPHAKKIFKLEAAHYQLRQPKTQNPVFHWFFTAAAGHSGYLVIVVKRL